MNEVSQPCLPPDARRLIIRGFGFSTVPSLAALYAEAVRSALWGHWNSGAGSIYVTRLLHRAAQLILPWSKSQSSFEGEQAPILDSLRNTLAELDFLGDIVELPHGRWMPAPLRFVRLNAINRWLLLGSVPNLQLPVTVRTALEHSNLTRLLAIDPATVDLPIRFQDEFDWRRAPTQAIDIWAREAIEDAILEPYGDVDRHFEYYAPAVAGANNTQFHRWQNSASRLTNGRYLVRSTMPHGPRHYSIAQLKQQKIIAIGAPKIGIGDIRRLMYGIDLLSGYPLKITLHKACDTCRIQLSSALPRSEHRLFVALGRLQLPPNGNYYPRLWKIQTQYSEQVIQALVDLGLRVSEMPG
jgi:hypothetical protein